MIRKKIRNTYRERERIFMYRKARKGQKRAAEMRSRKN